VDCANEYCEGMVMMIYAYPGDVDRRYVREMMRERVPTQADWEDGNMKEATIPSSPEHLIEVQKATRRTNTHNTRREFK
jgi:hypothetical protein